MRPGVGRLLTGLILFSSAEGMPGRWVTVWKAFLQLPGQASTWRWAGAGTGKSLSILGIHWATGRRNSLKRRAFLGRHYVSSCRGQWKRKKEPSHSEAGTHFSVSLLCMHTSAPSFCISLHIWSSLCMLLPSPAALLKHFDFSGETVGPVGGALLGRRRRAAPSQSSLSPLSLSPNEAFSHSLSVSCSGAVVYICSCLSIY